MTDQIPASWEANENLEGTEFHDQRFSKLIRRAILDEMIYRGLAGRDDEDSQLTQIVDQVEELIRETYNADKDVIKAAKKLEYNLEEPTDRVFVDFVKSMLDGSIFNEG